MCVCGLVVEKGGGNAHYRRSSASMTRSNMMRKTLAAAAVAVLALCSAPGTHAIYEDQAGLLDWKVEHLGKVSAVAYGGGDKRNHASVVRGTSRAVYVATDERSRAIARIDSKNGGIKWRQVLHEGMLLLLLLCSFSQNIVD